MSIPSGHSFVLSRRQLPLMKAELLVGLLIVMALTVGAALGFMAEQAEQPSDSDLSQVDFD